MRIYNPILFYDIGGGDLCTVRLMNITPVFFGGLAVFGVLTGDVGLAIVSLIFALLSPEIYL